MKFPVRNLKNYIGCHFRPYTVTFKSQFSRIAPI